MKAAGQRRTLAREYRPRQFQGVRGLLGQDHVTGVLRNQVRTGELANAYLFTGTRGVGKTTAARVLAMALNCQDKQEGEPCGSCETCARITGGQTTMDVHEMDGATNRGVDDARDLRERLIYAPSEPGRFKVYIIDEAHMLTQEAFNALLKVLEEPPPRVVFVFATTEPEKIKRLAPPILSRCQRFDFRTISGDTIAQHLTTIAQEEDLPLTEEAAHLLARRGRGSMRDALTAMDQVRSFHSDPKESITGQTIREVFNEPDERLVLAALQIFAQAGRESDDPDEAARRSRQRALQGVDYCTQNAVDHVEFFRSVRAGLHDIFRLKTGLAVSGWSSDGTAKLQELSTRLSPPELQHGMRLAQESARQMREPGTAEDPDFVLTLFFLNVVEALERLRSRDREKAQKPEQEQARAANTQGGRDAAAPSTGRAR